MSSSAYRTVGFVRMSACPCGVRVRHCIWTLDLHGCTWSRAARGRKDNARPGERPMQCVEMGKGAIWFMVFTFQAPHTGNFAGTLNTQSSLRGCGYSGRFHFYRGHTPLCSLIFLLILLASFAGYSTP